MLLGTLRIAATKASIASQAKSISVPKPKRRRLSDSATQLNDDRACDEDITSGAKLSTASGSDLRRLKRITTTDLERREKRLALKEQNLRDRMNELDERIQSLSKKEDQTSQIISQIAEREAQSILRQLEEHFTCALCYEILASPYSLTPSHCGHTFCGLCILKWFFSRLHRVCGLWHESVDCPICRSVLTPTPERIPRLQSTFPFVPNRVTASVVESLVEKLINPPLYSQANVKKEEIESTWGSQSRKHRGRGCVRKREPSEEKDSEKVSDTLDVIAWREGGHLRTEWLKKDREGKKEMAYILNHWSTMGSQDFINMKQKLGV
ncbi:Tripartite motif-containing protein 5 [Psilocybe cubensis]|uniref:Tripartite motif-containing protein 5 n=2 Tax=Psilocybe cubensis TaxID=181762 RepID=A0ACB8GVN3_PSICU|nr:Tripartite motif-containing protein 5 [Psilocybe cubensis]KAH9479427.1 Tripartite motif-containing protein 5 [Psilocybe cubensis]